MPANRQEYGFSFIEVMIVVVIMGTLMTGVGLSIGASSRVQLRSSCWTLMAAARYAYSRAVTQGTTVRLVMDFSEKAMYLDETKGRVVLNREDETGEGVQRQFDDDELEARNLESGGQDGTKSKKDGFLDLSSTPAGSFGGGMGGLGALGGGMGAMDALEDGTLDFASMMSDMTAQVQEFGMGAFFGNATGYRPPAFKPLPGKRGKKRPLEGDTIFYKVFTPHESSAREEGRAFIYFFPNGTTEHTFVQLSDGEERIYTIEIHPLTAKSTFFNEEIEPEEDLDALQEAED